MKTRQLSVMDAASLQLEAPDIPMHVGALMIFEKPADADKAYVGQIVEDWRAVTEAHSPWNQVLTRPTRKQLRPRTVDTHDLDLEYHLRHLSLPAPGGERELGQLIARLHSQPMDLGKPLWECHVIDDLAGRRFAIYVKLHHALVDGVSATRLLMRGLSDSIEQRTRPFWTTKPPSTPAAGSSLRQSIPSLADWRAAVKGVASLWRDTETRANFRRAPASQLNGPIGAQRRFATQSFALDRLKAVSREAGVSLNDVVLALVGGAARTYLLAAGQMPTASLSSAVPVSTRLPGDDSISNQVSMVFVTLATDVADPLERLQTIRNSTAAAKQQIQALPRPALIPYSLLSVAPFFGRIALGFGHRGRPLFNTVVSNVPGSSEDRFLCGARLQHCYPLSLVFPGMPLNVTCYSQSGLLNVGIIADRDAVPHVQRLAPAMDAALADLEEALGLTEKIRKKSKQMRKKSSV